MNDHEYIIRRAYESGILGDSSSEEDDDIDNIPVVEISNARKTIEKKTVLNINSSMRTIYNDEVVPEEELTYINDDNEVQTFTLLELQNNNPDIIYYELNSIIRKKTLSKMNAADYEVQLPRAFRNVKSIRLLTADIPRYINIITSNNNIIFFRPIY